MYRANLGCILLLLGVALALGERLNSALLSAQDEAKDKLNPKKGEFLPKPFECLNINGPAKGRPHCFVCKFALSPAVLILAKEPADGKDETLNELMAKLDEVAADFVQERNFAVGVVILSSDGRDSTNNANEEKSADLIKEAVNREKLTERLGKRAEKLKHVIVGYLPEMPKGYKVQPKAEITAIFYERMKVKEIFTFGPGALEAKDVAMVVKTVRDGLPLRKKPAEEK